MGPPRLGPVEIQPAACVEIVLPGVLCQGLQQVGFVRFPGVDTFLQQHGLFDHGVVLAPEQGDGDAYFGKEQGVLAAEAVVGSLSCDDVINAQRDVGGSLFPGGLFTVEQ